MTLLVTLTVLAIVLFVVVLAFFLNKLAKMLAGIADTLGQVTWGVRTVEKQCATIGPAADVINDNLSAAAGDLERAAVMAERYGR